MNNMKCPYCGIEIDEHKATPCLDGWVAQVVMGFRPMGGVWYYAPYQYGLMGRENGGPPFAYSAEIASAWLVVEKAGPFSIIAPGAWFAGGEYKNLERIWDVEFEQSGPHWHAQGETAPLAICRAAIKSIK